MTEADIPASRQANSNGCSDALFQLTMPSRRTLIVETR
jgi:hypothetical protein